MTSLFILIFSHSQFVCFLIDFYRLAFVWTAATTTSSMRAEETWKDPESSETERGLINFNIPSIYFQKF